MNRKAIAMSLTLALFFRSAVATEYDLVGEERSRLKPRCDEVVLNGVVADTIGSLENFKKSKDKAYLLERDLLRCNRNYCAGFARLSNVRAQIQNWTKNYLHVAVPLNFDTGQQTVYLWVARVNAICP